MSAQRPDSGPAGLICLADFRPPSAHSKFDVWKRSIAGLVSIDGDWVVDFGRAAGGDFIRVWAPRDAAATVWRHTEGQLRVALAEVDLIASARPLVEEFLDHNELGLAYESLTEAIAARRQMSSAGRQALASAAVLMAVDPAVGEVPGVDASASPSD
jgi:hypothetical protein